ncbi:MAG: hypothetical protein Q9169_000764 [Polycauliona sp. 2 TL-2023]
MAPNHDMSRLTSNMKSMKIDASKSSKPSPSKVFEFNVPQDVRQGPEDDGNWKTVESKRPDTLRPQKANNRQLGSPSAAARSRNQVYGHAVPSSGGYKQEFLPAEQQDPVLLHAQKHKGTKLPKDLFRPGTLFRAVLHDQDFAAISSGSQITVLDKHRTPSAYGTIFTKVRHMIVLALYEDHYIAIPLFTHNGTGLDKKVRKDEFVSIRDNRDKNPIPPLSKHKPLRIENVNAGVALFDPKSTAHITYQLARKYDLPIIPEGSIAQDSLDFLIMLFREAAPELQSRPAKH